MANRQKKILKEILALPSRTLAGVVLSHGVLLGITLVGGLSYLIMQAVLAAELLLLSLATIPLYPERGLRFRKRIRLIATVAENYCAAFLYP